MRRTPPPDDGAKFSGNLRHYHRTGAQTQRTWDDWVEGSPTKARKPRRWPKIAGIMIAVLVLCAVITGLIIELG